MPSKSSSTFRKILLIVNSIPSGRVATYGQIAGMIPIPSARVVGFALAGLRESQENTPWHRVVNRHGEISTRRIDEMMKQKALLVSEGVEFDEEGRIDFAVYGW